MPASLSERTRAHYDAFPFIEGGPSRIAWWRRYLADWLPDDAVRGRRIVDVGSSVGEVSRGLLDRGARVVCLDLSGASLRRCQEINPEASIVQASALALPFPDGAFDHALAIGVLHHTPDCRRGLQELARVTAPGGTCVVFLYNAWSVYHLVYRAFAPVRATVPLTRVPAWCLGLLQPFVRTHLGQTLGPRELRNLLGDKLWTPRATFHRVATVRRWGEAAGLRLVATRRFYLGYANVMRFERRPGPAIA